MGRYIDQSDVEDHFGVDNIKRYSNLQNNTGAADTNRINRAIEWAEDEVDGRFQGFRNQIPFSPVPEQVKRWCSLLAGIWLYRSRGLRDTDRDNRFNVINKEVDDDIRKYNAGQRLFNLPQVEPQPGHPV